MESFSLNEASQTDENDILRMLWEIGPGENGFQNSAYNLTEKNFSKWIQSCIDMSEGINLNPKYVPQTIYWLRRDGYPIGMSKLRSRLNEKLLKSGGHIGFCIRPTERGKGYAKIILRKTVNIARKKNINKVLLTCAVDNLPSMKTIEGCNAYLEKIENDERHYWLNTSMDKYIV